MQYGISKKRHRNRLGDDYSATTRAGTQGACWMVGAQGPFVYADAILEQQSMPGQNRPPLVNICGPMTAQENADRPANTGGVVVTQIQTPTQTSTSGQSTDIGSPHDQTQGVASDILPALVSALAGLAQPAAPASSSVTVATGSPSGFDLGAWLTANRTWLLWGGGALLAFLAFKSLPKSGTKKKGKKK